MVAASQRIQVILKVNTLKEGILERQATTYDPRKLDLEFVDLHYLENVTLEGFSERIQQTVTFQGILTSRIEQICARCLEHIENNVSAPFSLSYAIEGRDAIDATNDLRDILILGHPDRFLCTANCRGICLHCGTNLNREVCRCQNDAQPAQYRYPIGKDVKGN